MAIRDSEVASHTSIDPISHQNDVTANLFYEDSCPRFSRFDGEDVVYIATQGPKPETVNDFWLMIWNENVRCIAAIVLLIEGGKPRCHRYWVNEVGESAEFGPITVKLTALENFAEFARRTMRVQMQGMKPRSVVQLQYLVWPDKSVPDHLCSVISFRNQVRKSLKSTSSKSCSGGPLLVHCSAGVGRTGTFIALDMLLEEATKSDTIDIYGVVEHLRHQRMSCVQVKDQYELLYKALLDYHRTGRTSVSRSVAAAADAVKRIKRQTAMETEFKLLTQLKPKVVDNKDVIGLQDLNRDKNRRQDVFAVNKHRVVLRLNPDGTDYINAAVAMGYKSPTHYILTQLPLAQTTGDFWQMMNVEKCESIVLLDQTVKNREAVVEFWPRTQDTPTVYGDVTVCLSSTQSYGQRGRILVHTLLVNTQDDGKAVERAVRIHELTTWIEGKEIPDNVDDVLELIHLVADWEQERQASEERVATTAEEDVIVRRCVTVMCLDGATRSGLYAATSLTIDRLKCDDEIDVFLSCRYITAARPQAITSQEQYEFVNRAAVTSLDWTPGRWTVVDEKPSNISDNCPIYGNIDPTPTTGRDEYALQCDPNIYANATPGGGQWNESDGQNVYANFTG